MAESTLGLAKAMPASPRAIILFIFFLQAFAAGGLFPRIPDIQVGLALDEATLGLALTTAALGGLVANLIAGRAVQALGTRIILVLGIPAVAGLTAGVALAPGTVSLFLVLLLMGISFSLTNVAMNIEADRVEAATGRRVMNRCHGLWSAGMLFSALLGVLARAGPISAPVHLSAIFPLTLAATVIFVWRLAPSPRAPDDKSDRPRFAMPTSRTILLVLFGLSGGIAQSGTQNWSVLFMQETFSAPDWVETLTLPSFLIAMTLGRIWADGWIERFGPAPVARALASVALLGSFAVVFAPNLWIALAGFAMMGAGTAVLFPLMITGAARGADRPAAEAVSAVLFLTGLAMLAAPAIMGWIAEGLGLRAAFWALVPPFVLTLALIRVAAPPRV